MRRVLLFLLIAMHFSSATSSLASLYCPIEVAASVTYQRTKNLLLRARLFMREALIRGPHDPPSDHPLVPKAEVGDGPGGVFLPYVPPPPGALKGFWEKALYYDMAWLANVPVRKVYKNAPLIVQNILRAYGFEVSGAVQQAEHTLSPIRTVGLTLVDKLVFKPIDRFILRDGKRISEVVRGSPAIAANLWLYMTLVNKPTEAFFEWAGAWLLRRDKGKAIDSDFEFIELKKALESMKVDLDVAIDRMDHMRNQYMGLREAWAGLSDFEPNKSGARSAAELAMTMLERKPPGSRFGNFTEAQRERLSEEAQVELMTEELVWQGLDIAPETLGYLQEGPPLELFPNAKISKTLTREQKVGLIEQAFARLIMAFDQRVFFEDWKGVMPSDPPAHATAVFQYFTRGTPGRIFEEFKAGKVNARKAVAMTLGWEMWQLRLNQWEIMGVPLNEENRKWIVQIVSDQILGSGGDTSKLPK